MILVWLPWLMVVLGLLGIIYYSVISYLPNIKLILFGIGLVVLGFVFKFHNDQYDNSLSVVGGKVVENSLGYVHFSTHIKVNRQLPPYFIYTIYNFTPIDSLKTLKIEDSLLCLSKINEYKINGLDVENLPNNHIYVFNKSKNQPVKSKDEIDIDFNSISLIVCFISLWVSLSIYYFNRKK